MPDADTYRILAIDDERESLEALRLALAPRIGGSTSGMRVRETEAALFGGAPPVVYLAFDVTTALGAVEGIEALRAAREAAQPFSVVFLDARMPPGPHGLEAAMAIRKIDPLVYIVVVTAYQDVDPADFGRLAPPEDRIYFLAKPFHVGEVRQFARALSRRWDQDRRASDVPSPHSATVAAIRTAFAALSRREQQVFRHVVRGLANKEIGLVLELSPRTVENYRAKVMDKMKAESLPDLVRMAVRADLG